MNNEARGYDSRPAAAGPPPGAGAPYTAPLPPPAQPMMGRDPRAKSWVFASLLSCMPGLGQIYIGYYRRGFIHIMTVAGIITMLASDVGELTPFLGLFLAFFWLYNIIDAGRRAALYNQALLGTETIEPPAEFGSMGWKGSLLAGLLLTAGGTLLLLHTRFDISLAWMEDWWPVGPIGVGVYLLIKAMQDRQADLGGDAPTDSGASD